MNPEDDLSYIALCPTCGGWQGITVICYETPERQRAIARSVARWIRAGLKIETWTMARVRTEARVCQCLKPPNPKPKTRNLFL
jgi:hypothetical protein